MASFLKARMDETGGKGKIAIVGAGLIGRAWAIVFARAGHPVSLFDADRKALERSIRALETALTDLETAGLLDELPATVRARVTPAFALAEAVANAAYVQENIGENLAAKQTLFAELDLLAPTDAILASSTSTIPASQWSEGLAGRARCLVAHPVNPPHLVPLVELSPAPWTSANVVANARKLHQAVGQVPIVMRGPDAPSKLRWTGTSHAAEGATTACADCWILTQSRKDSAHSLEPRHVTIVRDVPLPQASGRHDRQEADPGLGPVRGIHGEVPGST